MGGYAGSWGSYGGYGYGSYGGSSGGSSGGYISYGSSGGSSGGWGAPGMIVTPGAAMPGTAAPPAAPAPPAPAPGPGPSEPSPSDKAPADGTTIHSTTSGDSVLLTVKVPAEAKVFVNGHLTTSTGTERQFISRGLVAGSRYTYDVRAEIEVNGKIVSDVKTVSLTAGDAADLAFNLNGETEMQATSPVVTKVTVHVPSGARLFLAGREVPGTGEVREFSTSRLAPGNQWNNYTVRAEAELNGKVVTREQNLSLKAGDSRELSFDFGDEAVASTNSVTAAR